MERANNKLKQLCVQDIIDYFYNKRRLYFVWYPNLYLLIQFSDYDGDSEDFIKTVPPLLVHAFVEDIELPDRASSASTTALASWGHLNKTSGFDPFSVIIHWIHLAEKIRLWCSSPWKETQEHPFVMLFFPLWLLVVNSIVGLKAVRKLKQIKSRPSRR